MLILVTYDIQMVDSRGARRLRRVAKICQNYGVRVQNSVFECVVDTTQLARLKHDLFKEMDEQKDSVRFYRLGENYKNKVEHYGTKVTINVEESLIL